MPHLLDTTMFRPARGSGGSGGVRQVIEAKRAHFAAAGWRHSLMAPDAREVGDFGRHRFVFDRAKAARLIEQAQPDLVEAADPYLLGWGVRDACARLQVPAVAFCHSDLPALVRHWAGGDARVAARWLGRRAAGYLARLYSGYRLVLAPNRAMTARLQAWGVRQAVHQPLGVDSHVFSPAARDPVWRCALERQLGVMQGTRLLVYAGRFAAEKNLDVLVQAVDRLGPRHVLIAVGAGPRPPAGPRVRVLPPEHDRQKLARLLASADAFVHSGDQETFGMAALEAMACGVPVVVSDRGGLGELADGVGITVPSQRPLDWAAAVSACLHDGDSRLSRAALARARALDWKLVFDQWMQRYRVALRDHASAGATEPIRAAQSLAR